MHEKMHILLYTKSSQKLVIKRQISERPLAKNKGSPPFMLFFFFFLTAYKGTCMCVYMCVTCMCIYTPEDG